MKNLQEIAYLLVLQAFLVIWSQSEGAFRIWCADCFVKKRQEDAMNPDEAIKIEGSVGNETDASAYSAYEERAARIPSDESGQVYELRRMFRL